MVRLVAYLRHDFTEIFKTSLDARSRDDQREGGRVWTRGIVYLLLKKQFTSRGC